MANTIMFMHASVLGKTISVLESRGASSVQCMRIADNPNCFIMTKITNYDLIINILVSINIQVLTLCCTSTIYHVFLIVCK